MLSGTNLDYFVLDLYKKVKCMLKKLCHGLVKVLFENLFAILQRAQPFDKNWSGSTFQPLSYIIWVVDITNVHFLNFRYIFQWKSA